MSYTRKNHFFSSGERAFYDLLRRLTPRHTVFAKVRLAELVALDRLAQSQSEASEIEREQVDFVVCDGNLAPIVAIDLEKADAGNRRTKGEPLVAEVLAAATVPVIRLQARRNYGLDEIHQLLLPYLRLGTSML